uniref:Uncharacterized protein n=1 Tax=Pygocentrus nattereri TaxID=42514 RepID=A0AAR2M585_PYGNA
MGNPISNQYGALSLLNTSRLRTYLDMFALPTLRPPPPTNDKAVSEYTSCVWFIIRVSGGWCKAVACQKSVAFSWSNKCLCQGNDTEEHRDMTAVPFLISGSSKNPSQNSLSKLS